jgi:Protein of unknwon function (DUF3310)
MATAVRTCLETGTPCLKKCAIDEPCRSLSGAWPHPRAFPKYEPVDKVNHPLHYGGDTIYETIKVIEAWNLGFNLGNAVKYISRADNKGNKLEDLKKSRWYLDREITNLEEKR